MSSITIFFIAITATFGCTVLGQIIAPVLPDHHLSGNSKDVIKLGAGVLATLTALVLGLLLGSTKNSFDEMNSLVVQSAAKIIMIDEAMREYGPEANDIRDFYRRSLSNFIPRIWPDHPKPGLGLQALDSSNAGGEVLSRIRKLQPSSDSQRLAQSHALQLMQDVVQNHWLFVEKALSNFPSVFLAIMLFWTSILFATYGLFAPRNATVLVVLLVCSLSVSSAVFLIHELSSPFYGIIKISNAPMLNALQHLNH